MAHCNAWCLIAKAGLGDYEAGDVVAVYSDTLKGPGDAPIERTWRPGELDDTKFERRLIPCVDEAHYGTVKALLEMPETEETADPDEPERTTKRRAYKLVDSAGVAELVNKVDTRDHWKHDAAEAEFVHAARAGVKLRENAAEVVGWRGRPPERSAIIGDAPVVRER